MPTVTVIQPTIAAEQNTKIRCAAYCRVSSDSEDQLNSFMAQTRYYEKAFETVSYTHLTLPTKPTV